jgi:hypothetical protein
MRARAALTCASEGIFGVIVEDEQEREEWRWREHEE